MERVTLLIYLVVLLGALSAGRAAAAPAPLLNESNSWAFTPPEDHFTNDALLDLRYLNEDVAGQTGFVHLSDDGESFVRGDGKPIRFWSVLARVDMNTVRFTPEDIDTMYRFLAKRGVNMIRLFAMLPITKEGAQITDVDQAQIDRIWRHVSIAKKYGVYAIICPYWAHFQVPASWGIDGAAGKSPTGLLFFNPRLQNAYRQWVRALYTPTNPYTGVPLKDDPAVAIVQIQNEDSLFFWTTQNIPEPQKRLLGKLQGDWLKEKYGSLDAALQAWDGYSEPKDDFANGLVWLVGDDSCIWELTQTPGGGKGKRLQDEMEFLGQLQHNFYSGMRAFLRNDLGCKQIVNASNWRTANQLKLEDTEHYTYTGCDVAAINRYTGGVHVGQNRGYRIDPGHLLVNRSVTRRPLQMVTNLKQPAGMPFIITENAWTHPNRYQTEGPFLAASYMGLSGVDTLCWFCITTPTWELDPRRLFWQVKPGDTGYAISKWTGNVPQQIGMFPGNALIHRLGYVREGDPVVREVRPLDALWQRRDPIIAESESFDPIRDTQDLRGATGAEVTQVSRLAFLVGPVKEVFGGDPARTRVADLSPYIDGEAQTVRGNTGQVELNYGTGLFTLKTPNAQGVAGFLSDAGGHFELDGLTIDSDNDYATILAVSMDGRPLAESERVLVQVGTIVRLTGWTVEDATFESGDRTVHGKRILQTGKPPWRIANTRATLTIENPNLAKATLLDEAGYVDRSVPVTRRDGTLSVRLPEDTMYVILSAGE
ncbi:MAG: hypothetical protein ACOC7S_02370 [Planctomycetota bacterium]